MGEVLALIFQSRIFMRTPNLRPMLDDKEKDFKENPTFDDLPQAVSEILRRLDRIERKLEIREEGDEGKEEEERVLNTEQAAELLGIAKGTVYKKLHADELPCYRPQGFKKVLFLKSDLIEFIRSGRVKTAEEMSKEAVEKMQEMRRKNKEK